MFHSRDEADTIRSLWTDECDERNAATIHGLQLIYDEQVGVKCNDHSQKEGRERIIPLKETIKSIAKLLNSLKSESRSIWSQYQFSHHLTEQNRDRFTYLRKRIEVLETVSKLLRSKSKAKLQSLFGDRLQYLPLVLECYHSQPFGIIDVVFLW